MTNILVTGAGGFVGRALASQLLHKAGPDDRLTLFDLRLDPVDDPRVRHTQGSLTDPDAIAAAMADQPDTIFHLASVPGGAAERDYEAGRDVNLLGTLALIEATRTLQGAPRFVFASSVAVYGGDLSCAVEASTVCQPAMSYGAHKLIGEILVADASRRGWIGGCSLRLPGVVARPPGPSGMVSAFMSELFWALRDGRPVTLPVDRSATSWWISVDQCVENLVHAAHLSADALSRSRTCCMPVLWLSVGAVVDALVARFGADRASLVTYARNDAVQALFGASPRLLTPEAEALGFRHDGSAAGLVERVLGG